MSIRTVLVLLVSVLQFSGCAIGPNWKEPVELPGGNINVKGKTIVVSDFKYSEQQVSYTQSATISKILESAYVQDNSFIMAQKLSAAGFQATAREDVRASKLKKNEILMRGALVVKPMDDSALDAGSAVAHFLVFGCSLLTIGGIAPSPFPLMYGTGFSYRVELIDPSGSILYQSGDRHTGASYTSYYVWGPLMYADQYRDKLISDMPDIIIDSLKKHVLH